MVGDFGEAILERFGYPGLVGGGAEFPVPPSLGSLVVGAADGCVKAQLQSIGAFT